MRPIESLPRRCWKMAIKRAALSPFIFFCNGPLLRLRPFVASSENLYSNLFLPLCLLVNTVTRYFLNCPTVLFFYLSPPWAPVQAMTPPWFCFTVFFHISWRTNMKTGFLSTSLFHFYTFHSAHLHFLWRNFIYFKQKCPPFLFPVYKLATVGLTCAEVRLALNQISMSNDDSGSEDDGFICLFFIWSQQSAETDFPH